MIYSFLNGMQMENLDWTYIRSFLAVAESGSLSAAARRIGQSQPTLGRHVRMAEEQIGTKLFIRVHDGLELTDAGRLLLEPARQMAQAHARFATVAAGRDTGLQGTVRITASVVVSHYLLPEILSGLRREEPDIEIELVPTDASENLLFREADLAIRMYRPTQLDVVTRKITDLAMQLYGASELLARMEEPQNLDDLSDFPFVGFDRSDLIIRSMREMGIDVDRHFFGIRCDDQAAYWQLIRSGCGLGAMQAAIGDRDPAVKRLCVQPELPSLPMWLAAHEAMHKTPRVKRVWDFLAQELSKV